MIFEQPVYQATANTPVGFTVPYSLTLSDSDIAQHNTGCA